MDSTPNTDTGIEDRVSKLLLDYCSPNSATARLGVLLGSIENGRMRIIRASRQKLEPERIAGIAMEEFAKIISAADLYRKAAGLPQPIDWAHQWSG